MNLSGSRLFVCAFMFLSFALSENAFCISFLERKLARSYDLLQTFFVPFTTETQSERDLHKISQKWANFFWVVEGFTLCILGLYSVLFSCVSRELHKISQKWAKLLGGGGFSSWVSWDCMYPVPFSKKWLSTQVTNVLYFLSFLVKMFTRRRRNSAVDWRFCFSCFLTHTALRRCIWWS